MVESNSLLKVGTLLNHDKYRIERYLASGGFGNTYEGVNVTLGKKCAIKEFFLKGIAIREDQTSKVHVAITDNKRAFNSQKEKFTKEAHRLSRLDNNHIVKVFDLFEENGTVYYVMDYIEGESLRDVQKRKGSPFSEKEVLSILSQMLDALNTIHQHGLLHMDIKPANIMIDQSGKCTLIDFGASKQSAASDGATTSSTLAYTPGYAPVEQIGGSSDRWGPWTDFYALGATLYNLLTNENPVNLDIEEDGEAAFKFPPEVSSSTRLLIQWLMSPKRKDRPQNEGAIRNCMIQLGISALPSLSPSDGNPPAMAVAANPHKPAAAIESGDVAAQTGFGLNSKTGKTSSKEETQIEAGRGTSSAYKTVISKNNNATEGQSSVISPLYKNNTEQKKKGNVGKWVAVMLSALLLIAAFVFLVKSMDADSGNQSKTHKTAVSAKKNASDAQEGPSTKSDNVQVPPERNAETNQKTSTNAEASSASSKQENPARNLTFTVGGVSFTMVYVPGGTFIMGATSEQEEDLMPWEYVTPHNVTLSSYHIGQTEVTQALWKAVMGSNPSKFRGDRRPVDNVSWNDCQTFISRLNAKTGKNFRLRTEAEWEYAARGGNSGGSEYAGSDNINSVAWHGDNSGGETHNVATKSPNGLGIYDMSGNVCEWCQDWLGEDSSSSQTNPKGPSNGDRRVFRGGDWEMTGCACSVWFRGYDGPSDYYCLGLRISL